LGSQICVSVRDNLADNFSLPGIIHPFSLLTPEATTLTTDQSKIYYHKKSNGLYKLFLRYRSSTTGINESENILGISMFPNPAADRLNIELLFDPIDIDLKIYNSIGQIEKIISNVNFKNITIETTHLKNGLYFLKLQNKERQIFEKFVVDN
jgi:Secretion system C-terminal sorting domain